MASGHTPEILVSDLDDSASDVELSLSSSIDTIVPVANATLTGEGSERELILMPAPDAHGIVTITVIARDPRLCAKSLSFALQVLPAADAPTAEGFTVTTLEDTPVSFGLPVHDPDGDPLTALLLRAPAHGVLVGWQEWNNSVATPHPPIYYQPFSDFFGEDRARVPRSVSWITSRPAQTGGSIALCPSPDVQVYRRN